MNDDNDTAPELTPDAAERRIDRGMALAERMDLDGALADFAAVEAALRFSRDPAARVQWARSLNGLGFIDLMDAKTARAAVSELDEETERAVRWGLKQALARFDQALAIQGEPTYRTYAAGNRAYALALLGRADDAREAFRRLFAAGGRAAYDGQVRDTERHPIPEDRAVRRLIDEIWEEIAE
jgi:tetratricopeptide (TPR) repeat protein